MSGRSPTILAVTPSHFTPLESRFWSESAIAADAAGWRVVQIAASDIPEIPKAETIVIPRRLRDFARVMSDMPSSELATQPRWLTNQEIENQVEWEHRRHQLGGYVPEVTDGLRRLAWFTDRAIDLLKPSIVLTTNKIDHPCAFFRAAVQYRGVSVGLIERLPFDSIWYVPDRLFAESRLWTATDWTTPPPGRDQFRRLTKGNPAGFRQAEATDERPVLEHLPRPIVFVPFDNLLWTEWAQRAHPQRGVDSPAFTTPQDAIDDLSEAVGELGGSLVIKAHPSCLETKRLELPANAYLTDGALDHLIEQSDVVAAFNTKVAFVALALGHTTATFSENPAAASGLTSHWRDHVSTVELLRHALDPSMRPHLSDTDAFFTWLADNYFYDLDLTSDRSPRALVDMLISGMAVSGKSAPLATVQRLQSIATGVTEALPTRVGPLKSSRRDAGRVLIDVTRLVDPLLVNSGIARYGREMVRRLPTLIDGDLWAIVREPGSGWSTPNIKLFDQLRRSVNGRVIALRNNERVDAVTSVLGELTRNDVYHSIHLPLPSRDQTGAARRIVTVHDVLHLIRPELNPGITSMIASVLESIDVEHDVVVCDSHQTWRDLLKLTTISTDRVFIAHLGGTPALLHEPIRQDTVVAVLQSDPRKNAGDIVRAVAACLSQPEHSSTQFTAAVSSGIRDQASRALEESGFPRERTSFVVAPTDAAMTKMLRTARVFIFGSSYEGFGLPVIEAMAEGCPIVAPMNSSLIEVAGSAACYATSESTADLQYALGSVLRNDDYARELSSLSRRRARVLTWDHSATKLAEIYRQVRSQPDDH